MNNNTNTKAIVAGHICLDLHPQLNSSEAIEPGRLIHSGPMHFATGGAVANTGLALGKLGIKTKLIGCTGEDYFAPTIKKLIDQPNIETSIVSTTKAATSYSVVINPKGIDRSFIHHPGANDIFEPDWVTDEMLQNAQLLHFGYPPIMKKTFEDGGIKLANLFKRAQGSYLITSLDMCDFSESSPAGKIDWQNWLKRVLPFVDCFTPSYDELANMLKMQVSDSPNIDTLNSIADKCLELSCAFVLIKLGDKGVFAKAGQDKNKLEKIAPGWQKALGQSFLEPCYKIKPNGTTAAGDSTIAGFLAGVLKNKSIIESLKIATATGAICVESKDGINGITPLEQIEQRIDNGWEKADFN